MRDLRPFNALLVVTGFAAALASAPAAFAEEDAEAFAALDTDGDGYISMEEAGVHPTLVRVFADVDADGDEMLDRTEFDAAVVKLTQAE